MKSMLRSASQISLIFLIVVLAGCFQPPEFPLEPQISFERLHLTDTASLVLTFQVRDGDGDIGLRSESESYEDFLEPYHPFSVVTSGSNNVTFKNGYTPPYNSIPVVRFPTTYRLYKGSNSSGVPVYEYKTVQELHFAGESTFYASEDLRPEEFDCNSYEKVSIYTIEQETVNDQVVNEELNEEIDTFFVVRNPYHFNIYIELQIKEGEDYLPFALDECDPGYTARFPLFEKSNIGRPLDGRISYAFFSVLFQDPESSPLLTETLRLKFYIYDRALNQSNEVLTPDFKLLDLRQGDLVAN